MSTMICPLLLAGLFASVEESLPPDYTPEQFQEKVCYCRRERCAWWSSANERCAIPIIGQEADRQLRRADTHEGGGQ
jgi:hypothetical protein